MDDEEFTSRHVRDGARDEKERIEDYGEIAHDRPPEKPGRVRVIIVPVLYIIAGVLIGVLLAGAVVLEAPSLREWLLAALPESRTVSATVSVKGFDISRELEKSKKQVSALEGRFVALTPKDPYLIVSTSDNKIQLRKGREVIRRGICSTGSYVLLKSQDNREWLFKTPRGMFHVQQKLVNPVWRMPDWAFIEEGKPVPPPNAPERFEAGTLGEYGLAFGNGYLIHGTIYKRLLGMPVTHGCVRLPDDDLEVVYKTLKEGSKIFIY
jgi:L,D-transpeptidase ErfK/SrfK